MQAWVLFLDLLVNLRSYHNQWSRALSGDYGYKWLWLKWAPSIGSPGFPLWGRVKSSGCYFATCVRISQCRWFWDLFIMPLGSLLLEVFQAQLRPRWGDYISHLVWEYPKTPQEEVEGVAENKNAWNSSLACCHHDPTLNRSGWMMQSSNRASHLRTTRKPAN